MAASAAAAASPSLSDVRFLLEFFVVFSSGIYCCAAAADALSKPNILTDLPK
jgi:hypothetical protein